METDRELLELAAKAAGLLRPRYVDGTSWGTGISHGSGDQVYVIWNPLRNDDDALRLAVELRLEISYAHDERGRVFVERKGVACCGEDLTPDPYAAVRRAIVRCAAEVLVSGVNYEAEVRA